MILPVYAVSEGTGRAHYSGFQLQAVRLPIPGAYVSRIRRTCQVICGYYSVPDLQEPSEPLLLPVWDGRNGQEQRVLGTWLWALMELSARGHVKETVST